MGGLVVIKDVFLFIIFFLISVAATELVLYLLDPLLLYKYDLISVFFTGIPLVVKDILKDITTVYVLLLLIVIVVVVYVIVRAVIRRQRFSNAKKTFTVVSLVSSPFLISWLITGYIHTSSVIIVLVLCAYTVIAIVFARTTIERPFMPKPTEFNQGKLNPIIINILNLMLLM